VTDGWRFGKSSPGASTRDRASRPCDWRERKPNTQLKKLQNRARKLRIDGWTTFSLEGRTLTIGQDADALTEASKLDGCYVLTTDVSQAAASKDIIHDRYKDLAPVEWAFRESKTVHLEIRPVNVRLKTRTRGHAFFPTDRCRTNSRLRAIASSN
jgi:hypothetical protein